jgi:pyruvate kinase
VANAVMDGADAVMLSAETAAGKFPIEVIRSMVRTIASVEKNQRMYFRFRDVNADSQTSVHDNFILSACKLAKDIGAKAIVGMTQSGYTAFQAASYRPNSNIFVFTSNDSLLTKINLVWGAQAYHYDKMNSTDETIADVEATLKRDGHVKSGDIIIILASMPIQEKSRTNTLKLNIVK